MRRPSFFGIACCAAMLGGCSGSGTKTADTAKGEVIPSATSGTTLSLAAVAGRWNVRAVPETGDTTTKTFVLNATADSTGWTIIYAPNREPLPVRVIAVAGDSLVIETGPYQSGRRPGMQAMSHDVYRMIGDRLVGYGVGRYVTRTGPDSVLRLRLEGTRAP